MRTAAATLLLTMHLAVPVVPLPPPTPAAPPRLLAAVAGPRRERAARSRRPPAPVVRKPKRPAPVVEYPSAAHWRALALCESGGNPRSVSATGRYRGLYQFDLATWRTVGGEGDPAAASPAEQTRRARQLYRRAGWRPWPGCRAELGLP